MPFPFRNHLKAAALAACAALCAPLAAAAPSPPAPASAARAPLASPRTYQGFLTSAVKALAAPLAAFMAKSGQPSLSVAAGGFRELVTGERSPLCDHLDRDLTNHLRDDTPYGVPSEEELQDTWISIGGNTADLSEPSVLGRFGRLLSVDAVVTGDYLVRGDSISITVRLVDCSDANLLWTGAWVIPEGAVPRGDLNTYADTAPPGYGTSVAAPPPTIQGAAFPGAAPGAGAQPPKAVIVGSVYPQPPPGVRLETDVHETEFSIYRLDFEAGYEVFEPLNPTFRSVVKDLSGPTLDFSWADIVHAGCFLWDKSNLPELPQPIDSLFGYGASLSVTAPVRLGHYWVLYGGFGGRFETINVNNPTYSSQDTFSFGNDSFFGTAGVKVHRRDLGLDLNAAYDFVATYSTYLMVKLGLYYEYNFK